jgi:hypothetical protein
MMGFPSLFLVLPSVSPDDEILRLEQMARDGIRPPIVGLQTAPVRLKNGNIALEHWVPIED